jgi:hypothetical protein
MIQPYVIQFVCNIWKAYSIIYSQLNWLPQYNWNVFQIIRSWPWRPPIVQTYIMVHVNCLTKSSSNNKSKNLDFFKHQKTETRPYCHKIFSMSKDYKKVQHTGLERQNLKYVIYTKDYALQKANWQLEMSWEMASRWIKKKYVFTRITFQTSQS